MPIDAHEANRRSWNAVTPAHQSHKRDQAGFLRAGGSTLFPDEVELLGDLRGRRLVHLQCNCGQDTLSLARLGAEVTGVDIADLAIDEARALSEASGIPGRFDRADLFDWFTQARVEGRRFDVAFSSYGFLGWLSDLDVWARGLADVLEPGGAFVGLEFHPFAFVFGPSWDRAHPYQTGGVALDEEGVGDYVGASGDALAPSGFEEGVVAFENPHPTREFAWGVSDLLTALLGAGLRLEVVREYPYANGWRGFERMTPLPGQRWTVPEGTPSLPLMLGVVARKPG
ncbi:MAG: class I SAM-dependent methyltransferase [Myxococcales bacterium]|nr:class I SAM-dependent methyltransferase [Myxococcales bacterium]